MALALAMSLLGLPICSAATMDPSPTQVVERLHQELLTVMKQAEALGYAGRYQHLEPVVEDCYDLTYIARFAVGRYWKTFSDLQKENYLNAFRQMSIAIYANRFNGYSGERFETGSEMPQRKGRVLVKSVLVKATSEKIELNYLLHRKQNRWMIINVIAQGVSDLSLKRADYTSILKKETIDTLIDKIHSKIGAYAN
jgi:phospholipid transport system substrate-binding protein